ncbi:MAG: TniQ family protein [Paraglaciecola sp.]|uniref:TniQ family protein n=1 Tax=Alishewanella sp. HL-SH05 TaxID=3461145 RepID=UPI002762D1E6|nr:TniQ family protein [Paraglaciecola sp.]
MTFLLRPKPKHDETIESYVLRLAIANGYSSLGKFFKTLGLMSDLTISGEGEHFSSLNLINIYHSQISSQRRIEIIRVISKLADTPFAEVFDICLARSADSFSNNTSALFRKGVMVPTEQLLPLPSVKVCPACLKEAAYVRQLWHFKSYTICHNHRVTLRNTCQCGALIDIYSDLKTRCQTCEASFSETVVSEKDAELLIATWLAGQNVVLLPNITISNRWGVQLFYIKYIAKDEVFTADNFIDFLSDWPANFVNKLQNDAQYRLELALRPIEETSFKDIFSNLLIAASRLPSRTMSDNIVLRAVFKYLYKEVLEHHSSLGQLLLNSIEVSILLNTTTEQVAALYEQGFITPHKRISNKSLLSVYSPIFQLQEVLALWLTSYQSDSSNLRYLTSRW